MGEGFLAKSPTPPPKVRLWERCLLELLGLSALTYQGRYFETDLLLSESNLQLLSAQGLELECHVIW